jgi:TnpA family transposase
MQHQWLTHELEEIWSLNSEEQCLLLGLSDVNRLGFAICLKFCQHEGCFPSNRSEVPRAIVEYLAEFLGLSPSLFDAYTLLGRSNKRHRSTIRAFLGVRVAHRDDLEAAEQHLVHGVFSGEHTEQTLIERLRKWFGVHKIEPPVLQQQKRMIRNARHRAEEDLFDRTHKALPERTKQHIDTLLSPKEQTEASHLGFHTLKFDPARPSLETVLKELEKLDTINRLALPPNLFRQVPAKMLSTYRLRAGTESISELRQHPEPIRYTLVAAFCYERRGEIIDGLADLLIQLVHKIGTKAEKKVVQELLGDFQAVHGKSRILYQLADAALGNPNGLVKDVLFSVVNEDILKALVKEYQTQGPGYQRQVQRLIYRSYRGHYRRMVPKILAVLQFRSNNTHHRPVIQALDYLKRLPDSGQRFIDMAEVPVEAVVPDELRPLVIENRGKGDQRINRIPYEVCVLQALRERLRCKEIWIEGANRYRNPDQDVPQDFADQRETYYGTLNQPMHADTFIAGVQQEMREALMHFNRTLPQNDKVSLRPKGKKRIRLSRLEPQPEPMQLRSLKGEIGKRWPMTSLLDVLKEAELRIGFTRLFKGFGNREILDRETLQSRLLLCLYGLGSNTGLKRILSKAQRITYDELLYVKRRFIHAEPLRAAIAEVANAIFAIRQPHIWGEGTTACASDAKKFGAWDQNLMTEWHIRYHGRGVIIYWHVEKNANCIYSQLKRCSASEVGAMIKGVLHHCTQMSVNQQYVDTHGQSEVAFAFCHLLGFNLMPRLKNIARQRLHLPDADGRDAYPNLIPILGKAINWNLIHQQYDEMIKFAVALRLGTAEPEAILRRFTRDNTPQHPTYRALSELGRAIKTIFLCHYLSSEAMRREIQEGLNVVENWNSANAFIFYGKNGEIAANQLAEQELSILSLHLLQICLVYVNTLMIQEVLAEPAWLQRMETRDRQALTPLIYPHINPYGAFHLDMKTRLPLQ